MKTLPIVYSCSGCSNLAQLANSIAVRLDRTGLASMSCIAGVGGNVPSLVKLAASGRRIVAIDGCELQCVRECLTHRAVTPAAHHVLTRYGLRKLPRGDISPDDVPEIVDAIKATL